MDSYDLFGEDGTGMLEGLADLGSDNFHDTTASVPVPGAPRDAPSQAGFAGSSYNQGSQEESPGPKMSGGAFVGGESGGWVEANTGGASSRGFCPQPLPPTPQQYPQQYHASHTPHTPHAPHTSPDNNLYSMSPQHHHRGINEAGWAENSATGVRGYPPPGSGYRHPHPYDHQKMHQYPQQQMGMQGGYIQRQPHYPPQQHLYPQHQHATHQQTYQGYSPMHQQTPRMGQHMGYHQMDMTGHQYSHMHQGNIPPHQGNVPPQTQPHTGQSIPQSHMTGHVGQMQPHPSVHPTHPTHTTHPHQGMPPNHPSQVPVHHPQNVPNHMNSNMQVGVNHANPMQNVAPHQGQQGTHPNQGHIQSGQGVPQPSGPNMSNMQNASLQTLGPGSHQPLSNTSHSGVSLQTPHQNVTAHGQMTNIAPSQSISGVHTSQPHPNTPNHPNNQMLHMGPYSQNNSPLPSSMQNIGYNQHSMQRSLDVNINQGTQYSSTKPITGLETSSSQYRAPYPQLSPQMSPRAQMSPRSVASQMSPRPVMSPAKSTNMSPHPHMQNTSSPRPSAPTPISSSPLPPSSYSQQTTLQALEQMVLPPSVNSNNDYPNYQGIRNPVSSVVESQMTSSPQSWQPNSVAKPTTVSMPDTASQPASLLTAQMNIPPILTSEGANELETAANMKTDGQLSNILIEPPVDGNKLGIEKYEGFESNSNITPAIAITEKNLGKQPESPESGIDKPEVNDSKQHDLDTNNVHIPSTPDKAVDEVGTVVTEDSVQNENKTEAPCNDLNQVASTVKPNQNVSSTSVHNAGVNNSTQNIGVPESSPSLTNGNISTMQQQEIMIQQVNVPSSTVSTISSPPTIPHAIPSNQLTQQLPNIATGGVHNVPPQMNQSQINPNMQSVVMHPNMQPHIGIPPNMTQMNVAPHGQFDGTNPLIGNMGMGPRGPNLSMGPMMPVMGPGIISHPGMTNVFQTPPTHHHERGAIQQQIQELFCMAPSSENQEKVMRLQERLNFLQQHETNDKCLGGPQCLLQNPIYGSTMIDSPQVSSTTGRGRGKGPSKPRKPRMKKAEKLAAQALAQTPENLPLSEDCVTAGTGLKTPTDVNDANESISENTIISSEIDSADIKIKKPRKPRQKKLKESTDPSEPTIRKERKKRQPRDPNTPRKRRTRKKTLEMENESSKTSSSEAQASTDNVSTSQNISVNPLKTLEIVADDQVTDFDDIPVSKIPIKELLEEAAAAKKERDESVYDLDDDYSSTPMKRRGGGARRGKSAIHVKRGPKRSFGAKRKRRGGIVPDSDGEPDDLITTPPPSPPLEGDCDSSKRRSARHTQRKKYTDDVMLRLSDDEFPSVSPSKAEKEIKPSESQNDTPIKETCESEKGDIINKPNYVYINTTDEDSMVVQFVLASRMGKRELIPKPPEVTKVDSKIENSTADSSESKTLLDSDIKEEKGGECVKLDNEKMGEVTDVASDESQSNLDVKPDTNNSEGTNVSLNAQINERGVNDDKQAEETKTDLTDNEVKNIDEEKCESATKVVEEKLNEQNENVEDSNETVDSKNIDVKENEDIGDSKEDEKVVPACSSSDDSSQGKADLKPSENNSESTIQIENYSMVSNTKDSTSEVTTVKETDEKVAPIMIDVEEFFVKYRNFSYLHCEWKTEEELYKGDKRISAKIKRFKQKQAQQLNIFECLDEEPFNPDYVEVDRILDVSEHADPASTEKVKHYLVKWKSLQYEDSTWELEEDIDPIKIRSFQSYRDIPSKDKWKFKRRPTPEQWEQLEESPLYKAGNNLRPYQLEGLNWLLFSWHNGRNCILADEMGLGKTIQSLTFINAVWEYGIRGPFLVIAPLSTIPNWQREFEGWTDMNVIVYHGSQQSKSMIQEYELFYKNEKGEFIKEITKFNVLITTFEVIVTDIQDLSIFNWRLCVIDEAHRLKNRNCKLLEGLRQLHLEHRVLLSGTPLQNNVNELFSLLNFLEPSQFSSSEAFLTEFGQLKSETEVVKLQALLKPMMLRRLKEDVEKSLAPKEETVIEVELTNIQKKYYRGILERNFSFLAKGTASAANIPNLMNTMMELRKCCIHPYLLNGAEEQIQLDYKQTHGEDAQAYYKALIQSSGKMVLVDKLLPKLKANGHRVLIFSQMVRCLDILEDYLMFRKYPFERIDGRIRGNLRQEAIDRFSKPDSDRFVFLLCTKAGGLGINLTAADTVIIYDSDWNPQNDLQAQARCHRIGQQKMVKIYRLLCRNTYEREMFDKASMKLGLDKAILQSMNTSQSGKDGNPKQLSKKEIEDLLKKGAYGAVMDEDNAGDKFCEEDIDMILARRTQVIQMEAEKGSTFSKASFSSSDIRSDIDIDDPDFWKKWAKKAEIDTTEPKVEEVLVISEPRRRTQIKRYGHDDGTLDMSEVDSSPDLSDEDLEGIGLRNKKKKEKLGKRGRRSNDEYVPRQGEMVGSEEVVYGNWARNECFKVERGLLTFGWARWEDILIKNQFRKGWTPSDVEDCARIIVLFCLRHYKGDEKIRNFIWDLIQPAENGEVTISHNHSGLHNPVPRGRNAKKKPKLKDGKEPKNTQSPQKWEDPEHWSCADKYDCETYLESTYKKHLFRHANKVLLRIRLMYYIKHEVIGDNAQQIGDGANASSLEIRVPPADNVAPRPWWDASCDISLLVGTYKHGYENYLLMRMDPQLVFLQKLGPPDDAECTTIKNEDMYKSILEQEEGGQDTPVSSPPASPSGGDESTQGSSGGNAANPTSSSSQWPSMQDLNSRLRRLITSYQRNYKKEELRMQQRARKMEKREKMDYMLREREREELMWHWSKAEEDAFCRTVGSYGVEFDQTTKSLKWGRFRALARLEKSDEILTDYLKAFMVMCKRQCGLNVSDEELPMNDIIAEPIGEERAITTLERIDLLRVLREEIISHPLLDTRLNLCENNEDTPPWWVSGTHDKILILGVCKHGLGDSYHKLFCDPKLPYADAARKWAETRHRFERKKSVSPHRDEEDSDSNDEKPAIRRSKRHSHHLDRRDDDSIGHSALSELETLAKSVRGETEGKPGDSPPTIHWFKDSTLEARLHHIAHAVQNNEWPLSNQSITESQPVASQKHTTKEKRSDSPGPPHAKKRKTHIAIDVETERAKLHALLSTPSPQRQQPSPVPQGSNICSIMKGGSGSTPWDKEDSSDSSRRSTPAPPPAHQRPSPAPLSSHVHPSPVDLSSPLDLSEVQDFSMSKKTTTQSTSSPSLKITSTPVSTLAPAARGKLDDTLSKLMKRKNVPEPEVIVGREKKRKKLDEIVLGLSAAKGQIPCASSALDITKKPTKSLLSNKIDVEISKCQPSKCDMSSGSSLLDSLKSQASSSSGNLAGLEISKKTPIPASVTLTPAAPPSSSPSPSVSQKPFSITVTSIPSLSQFQPKDLSAFLSQSIEQQNLLLKQHKPSTSTSISNTSQSQKKSYESMLADINKVADLSSKVSPYSHEAKVNKWLAEQTNAAASVDALADYMAQRRHRRSEASLDLKRLTGEEYVPVVHRLTGKRLSGPKAPQLKHLTQWIAENPMYDIDPKWTESIKESVKLTQDTRPPRSSSVAPANPSERKKGRPPMSDSSNAAASSMAAFAGLSPSALAGLNSSLLSSLSGLSGFDPKTLASTLSSLANFDPKILGGFDPKNLGSYDSKNLGGFDPKSLGSFDPKSLGFDPKTLGTFDPKLLASLSGFDPKNPLLMPFSGVPNVLSNLNTSNMFANLAGLGLSNFPGLDMAALGAAASGVDSSSTSANSKSKSRKTNDAHNSKGSSNSASSQFPFLFPNPGLLYPPLGLSGLNPFNVQSGMPSPYDALAHCGLMNGLGVSSASTSTHSNTSQTTSKTPTSHHTTSRPSSTSTTTSSSRHAKSSYDRQAQLQHLLLPPDTYLLESLNKSSSYEALLKASEKRAREAERKEATDLSKSQKYKTSDLLKNKLPPEFAAVQEQLLKSVRGDKKDSDISKILFEQMASGALSASLVSPGSSKKKDVSELKESYEKSSKSSSGFATQSSAEQNNAVLSLTKPREVNVEAENLIVDTHKDTKGNIKTTESPEKPNSQSTSPRVETQASVNENTSSTHDMDLEDLIAPSTVIRSGGKCIEDDKPLPQVPISLVVSSQKCETSETEEKISETTPDNENNKEDETKSNAENDEALGEASSQDVSESGSKKTGPGRKPRGKRQRDEIPEIPVESKRELRSSAGRQAAAAAARQAAAAKQNQQNNSNSSS